MMQIEKPVSCVQQCYQSTRARGGCALSCDCGLSVSVLTSCPSKAEAHLVMLCSPLHECLKSKSESNNVMLLGGMTVRILMQPTLHILHASCMARMTPEFPGQGVNTHTFSPNFCGKLSAQSAAVVVQTKQWANNGAMSYSSPFCTVLLFGRNKTHNLGRIAAKHAIRTNPIHL